MQMCAFSEQVGDGGLFRLVQVLIFVREHMGELSVLVCGRIFLEIAHKVRNDLADEHALVKEVPVDESLLERLRLIRLGKPRLIALALSHAPSYACTSAFVALIPPLPGPMSEYIAFCSKPFNGRGVRPTLFSTCCVQIRRESGTPVLR